MIATRGHQRASRVVALGAPRLEMLEPGRRCGECEGILSRYNRGPCEVCKQKQAQKAAENAGKPRTLILAMLSSADRTIPEMAGEVSLPVYDVRQIVGDLVKAGHVEKLGYVVQDGRKRILYHRLAGEA